MWRPVVIILAAMTVGAMTRASRFPADQEPLTRVSLETSRSYAAFQGLQLDQHTLRLGLDFQKMLRINNLLFIAARDHVFTINLTSSFHQHIVPQQMLTWTTHDLEKNCRVRGKNTDECFNYIKVLVARDDQTLFVCGTNGFNPTCRNYDLWSLQQDGGDLGGQARCPFDWHQSSVGVFAGGDFYSATTTDFLNTDAVIYRSLGESRPVLRTVKYDSKWLREPRFLHTVDFGNFVYIFFSEVSLETSSTEKLIFSRVARVCKNDDGGSPRVLERHWTSFLKARLNCSIPGDSFFYFDVLQSVSDVLELNHRPAVLSTFSTQANSIRGSALCAFYMDDIEETFSRSYKEQRSSESIWTSVPEDRVPNPRPGCCAGEGSASLYKSSTSFPDETLNFIKSFPLMDESVQAVGQTPFFTLTSSRVRLTQIVADTSAGPFKNSTVVFVGSEDGHVLKILLSSEGTEGSLNSRLLEDIHVHDPDRCSVNRDDRQILGLELDRQHHAVFVAFRSCVVRVPLSRCSNFSSCRRTCLSSKDPYCVWMSRSCCSVSPLLRLEGNVQNFTDSLEDDSSDSCSPAHDSPFGVRRPHQDTSLHVSLLLAAVLVAFLLGAVLSAVLVSCCCSHRDQKSITLIKEPEVQMSLHGLARLNGLLDGDGMKKVSNSYSVDPHERGLRRATDLPHVRSSLLSGLPTPDSTPELPIKSLKVFEEQKIQHGGLRTQYPGLCLDQLLRHVETHQNRRVRSLGGLSHLRNLREMSPGGLSHLRNLQEMSPGGLSHLRNLQEMSPGGLSHLRNLHEMSPGGLSHLRNLQEISPGGLSHLRNLQEMSPGGLSHLRNLQEMSPGGLSHLRNLHVPPLIPETESAPYFSSPTLPRDSLRRRVDVPPEDQGRSRSSLRGWRSPALELVQHDEPLLSPVTLTGPGEELSLVHLRRQVREQQRLRPLNPNTPALTPRHHQRELNY